MTIYERAKRFEQAEIERQKRLAEMSKPKRKPAKKKTAKKSSKPKTEKPKKEKTETQTETKEV